MPSSGISNTVVKHNITPERTLFCYVTGDADSLSVASYYKNQRQLPDENIIPLPCVTDRTISYAQYVSQIETPILNQLSNKDIWAIVFGYRVPNIINYNGELISVCSAAQRLGKAFETRRKNHTFNRVNYHFFDELDHLELFVTGVIDGPTKQDAINIIDRSMLVDNQFRINGNLLLDPYGNKLTSSQMEYQQEILDFITYDVDSFGLQYSSTVDIDDPYQDPTVLELQNDSFYWGWFQDKTSQQSFIDSKSIRTFLYNADDSGAENIRETPTEEGNWCNWSVLAKNPGYASTAGAVDSPGEDAYLIPRAFFKSLHFGAGLGEAFLSATKYTNWKLMLIGDPLMVVTFPVLYNVDYWNDSVNEIIYMTVISIEDYLNRMDRLNKIIDDVIQLILDAKDFNLMNTFYKLVDWQNGMADFDVSKQYVGGLVASLVSYVSSTTSLSMDEWLSQNAVEMSSRSAALVNSFARQTISSENIYSDGFWQLEFTYTHADLTLTDVHFVIEVYSDSHFANLVTSIYSDRGGGQWYYEKEVNDFLIFPYAGFPSNYSGRRVRFISNASNYLTHTELYYYKILVDDSSLRELSSGSMIV